MRAARRRASVRARDAITGPMTINAASLRSNKVDFIYKIFHDADVKMACVRMGLKMICRSSRRAGRMTAHFLAACPMSSASIHYHQFRLISFAGAFQHDMQASYGDIDGDFLKEHGYWRRRFRACLMLTSIYCRAGMFSRYCRRPMSTCRSRRRRQNYIVTSAHHAMGDMAQHYDFHAYRQITISLRIGNSFRDEFFAIL